eukprot:CAMPEP_0171284790 /NCGR_PEP_ID=MMETSP0790-20130122/68124_1 /TAXON_ID=2925 /ORGANISM="Alexandrium catenella, Strain OF101" /LENGTH=84 /DNA_ID=CAMNT_0011754105 /DNA_START=99 /DNA_END=350 /DNA_ORIENTATION=-
MARTTDWAPLRETILDWCSALQAAILRRTPQATSWTLTMARCASMAFRTALMPPKEAILAWLKGLWVAKSLSTWHPHSCNPGAS